MSINVRNIYRKLFVEKDPIKVENSEDINVNLNTDDLNVIVQGGKGTKSPSSTLQWQEAPHSPSVIYNLWLGYDGTLYGRRNASPQHRIFKYGEMENAESYEDGILIRRGDQQEEGTILGTTHFVHVVPDGIVYVSSDTDYQGEEKTWIYKGPDIHTEPELIAEYTGGYALQMTCDAYYNGVTNIILVGLYGRTPSGVARELVMSTDGGNSFETIKETTVNDENTNAHWHAVWFDRFQGRIWASEGDGENRNVHYTDDYGETWKTLEGDKHFEDRHQPTLITGWKDRVIFGRDAFQKPVGLDSFERVYTAEERDSYKELIDKYTLYTDENSSFIYPSLPIGYTEDGEGYILFSPTGSEKDIQVVLATGDQGASWTAVHTGRFSDSRIENLIGVTKEGYLCARLRTQYGDWSENRIIYAKTPEWR